MVVAVAHAVFSTVDLATSGDGITAAAGLSRCGAGQTLRRPASPAFVSLPGTKLRVCHRRYVLCSPLALPARLCDVAGELYITATRRSRYLRRDLSLADACDADTRHAHSGVEGCHRYMVA
jgi:hypothetical protein